MNRPAASSSRTRIAIISVAAPLVVGGGVWAWVARGREAVTPGADIPKEFTVDALKTKAESDPGRAWESMRELRDRTDLTDEQRDAIRDNIRKVMEEQMNKRLDEYYAAAAEARKAILDKHIDEMERMRKEREAREAEQPNRDENRDRERERRMREERRTPPTQTERKTRSESRNPDQQARRMAYWQAMRNRMQERGIQPPGWGGRGGPGGPGGGRGGPRG